jgi:antitoxin HicB
VVTLRAYVLSREALPHPSSVGQRDTIALDALESAKLALYSALREGRVSNVGLAERLGVTETVIRRLVDLHHRSHIGQVEKALKVLGRRLEVRVKAA